MRAFSSRFRAKNNPDDESRSQKTKVLRKAEPDDVKAPQRLKPDRWKAAFDNEGKLVGFPKVLTSIISGGVDSSIRCEVWEFLLGCYGVGTTSGYREEIRRARRKRYRELIEQCRMMHVSIGTGNLAYNVGSKIMDARITSRQTSTETSGLVSLDQASSTTTTDSLSATNVHSPMDFSFTSMPSPSMENDVYYSDYSGAETDTNEFEAQGQEYNIKYSPGRIGPNSPNIIHFKFFQHRSSPVKYATGKNSGVWTNNDRHERFSRAKSSPIPAGMPSPNPASFQVVATDERVSEWLWTLHKIVVDVVRTDKHLKFYDDVRNMARMSDILAVYAWIDPQTGYCQGMSDLLSPFIVLFDDDADAFWCFECLLRRMRQNFQMEGPTGVMRQLEALPRIMELVDVRMFRHLALIGADSFIFAFRMLLLHFRRELSFGEALCMWEMMWAADFDQATLWAFQYEPLGPLQIKPPSRSLQERIREEDCMDYYCSRISPYASPLPASESSFSQTSLFHYESKSPLCGLTGGGFWPGFGKRIRTELSFKRNGDSEISVFIVAAILVINRIKFLKEAHSMDDVIKMFNEIQLKIRVRSCVREAMKLRNRYQRQVAKLAVRT